MRSSSFTERVEKLYSLGHTPPGPDSNARKDVYVCGRLFYIRVSTGPDD
jgi:hypothetical protein